MRQLSENLGRESDPEHIGLEEVDRIGLGGLYAVSGVQIEPVGVYAGDGWFQGLYIENRPGVMSLRLGREAHKQRRRGNTLLVLGQIGHKALQPEICEDPTELVPLLVKRVYEIYEELDATASSFYQLSHEDISLKYRLFHDIDKRLEMGRLGVSSIGSINLLES